MELRFFTCNHCGNIVVFTADKGVPIVCCGEKMAELVPNTTDAAQEKHVPVINIDGNKVEVAVGSVEHPMTEEHLIDWICLHTDEGNQRKCLKAGEAPKKCFMICDSDKVQCAYAYCNLHGLWKVTV